ncbi:nucleotide exchange factor GrpE [Deinococcus roseus]|uniref:Protein GrpE n=1 Tax=Deinococcus roseus TaxID=392414 RepID=A0ABQ2DDT0_9DEIO|nr:nucleotide exchange factor GrpE [Deinococcus roseus]GGJ54789.1 protein GrpE [Deinococcus roseus]
MSEENLKDQHLTEDQVDEENTEEDTSGFDPEGFDPNMMAGVQEMMAKLQRADELEKEIGDLKGKYARLLADFENYRRRTNQDVLDAQSAGVGKAAEALFPIHDDLDRALQAAQQNPESVLGGIQGVYNNLIRAFEKLGLEQTGKEGEQFDPNFHEALTVVPGEQDDVIVQVYQSGFRIGSKLIRPARVVVSKK